MKAFVDREGCIGCTLCAQACPGVFRMDTDGKAEAYAPVAPGQLEEAQQARDACPVSVISLED